MALVSCLDEVFAASQQLNAVLLGLVREADARALAAEQGAPSTGAWLRERWLVSPGSASRLVKLAAVLDATLPLSAQALAVGVMNTEQVQVIGEAVAGLPRELQPAGERFLVDQAAVFGPRELGRLGERLFEVVAPDEAERSAEEALRRAEERAHLGRTLALAEVPGTGRVRIAGWLDREGAGIVRAALDPLCAPQPVVAGERDVRSPGQRRADALVEVCRLALACGDLPDNGGDRPQVVITVPLATLRDQVAAVGVQGQFEPTAQDRRGTATLDDGSAVTAETSRRIACDAGILPAVLGGRGQVLDLGQQRRLFTGALRRALVLRDRGCAFPACDRPARWCDGHHIVHWADGGPTSLVNAVLLCGYHHRIIHKGQWQVSLNSADGLPEFTPPLHLDPLRRPRRNTYHRRL